MPIVMLPAKDVEEAAKELLAQAVKRSLKPPTMQTTVLSEPRKPDPDPRKLEEILFAAEWLTTKGVPNAQVGLTLEEAELIEPMLPRYV